ncbi:MAG: F0F1 ATP synthase subunit B [Melioribacteraceae bacterium]|nr:F0F1 ATP synthase subunit B [Melioribacteraceae bacterium]
MFKIALLAFYSGDGGNGGLLDVAPGLMIWTTVTFILLLLVLKKLAWKPIINSLNERENFIKDSLEKAEKARADAEVLLEENRKNLARAEEDAQKVITQGREYSEKLKAQALEESKAEAKKMIEDATLNIDRKTQEAFSKLKDQIVDIAVDASEKIIRENLDKEKQKNIVDKYIDDLQKN